MNDALGMKVRMAGPTDMEGLKKAGETLAAMMKDHAREVWVYVFAHDSDMHGVATCVSYVSDTQEPITEFIDPRLLVMLKSSAADWN